jgi:hypothetical protein
MLQLIHYPWPLPYSMETCFSTSAGIEPIVTIIELVGNRTNDSYVYFL